MTGRLRQTARAVARKVGLRRPEPIPVVPRHLELREAITTAIDEDRPVIAANRLVRVNPRWRRRPQNWQWISQSSTPEKVSSAAIRLSTRGYYAFAADILAGVDWTELPLPRQRAIGRALAFGGENEKAIEVLESVLAAQPEDSEDYTAVMREQDTWRLQIAQLNLIGSAFVAEAPTRTDTEVPGFVLIYNPLHPVTTGLMVPLSRELLQRGYAVAACAVGTTAIPPSGVDTFDGLQWSVAPDGGSFVDGPRREMIHDWTVDWSAGVVEAEGINYFDYFQERLSQRARVYRADILGDPETAARFEIYLRGADVALGICERLLEVAALGKPVRVALMDSHFAPQGIIREWCDRVGRHHGIHAVVLSVGYENYFSNLTSLEASTLAVEDLTAQPELRQPFLGGTHRLEATLRDCPDLDRDVDDEVLSWICQDRSKVGGASRFKGLAARIDAVHAAGGKVFVALGKVSVDFAAPGDRGFVHADFVAWMNHLIEGVAGSNNLLLIKPHPHELRPEIVVEGVQLLRDLVVPDLPTNVVFLDHDSYNTHELADIVDAAFLWNGTASLEFSVLGVPVIPASIWAVRDYPVGLEVLSTREEYDAVLKGVRSLRLCDGVQRRSASYLRLMRSDYVAMPYQYLRRAATNLGLGHAPKLNAGQLASLDLVPDPYVVRAADRFFEFDRDRPTP